ncbi:12927_t:CDS:2, partial [Racocetra persica]
NQTKGNTQNQLNYQDYQDIDISELDKLKVLGGDVSKIARYNNTHEWLESLKSYDNCEIILYDDKLSLYELLPEKLKSKGYKIFASIFNVADREPLNTFSIRIDYQDSDNPYFVIHCLEPVTKNSPPISLLIPWMNHDDAEIEIPGLITQKHCWIGTCVLHCDENPGDPAVSRPLIMEPEGQIWESRENMKHQTKNKNNIFTMRRWLLPRDERLIFASLFGSNSYKYQCHPFFLNISQDYFIIKSFENFVNQPINQINYVAMPRVEGNEKKETKEIFKENTQPISSNHDHLDPIFTENIIKFLKLKNGLIVDSRDIYTATNQAFNFESIAKNIKGCYVKISLPKDRKELYLLKNHMDITSFQLLPPKLIQIMLKSNILNDNLCFDHVQFEVYYPKIELNLNKETIKPAKEIKKSCGQCKLILGQKLYRTSVRTPDLDEQRLEIKKNFFQNYLSNIEELFVLWDYQYRFDETYLMTKEGKSIEKNNVEKWVADNSKQDFKLLRIINRSKFIPLYEIFEKPISRQIKTILGIDNLPKILMTGIVQVIKDVKYYKINFSSNLGSSNYYIFAKLTSSNKQSFDKTIVNIQSESKKGFLAIIETFDEIKCIDTTDLQIIWMLIGFPDEINFYSMRTRDLSLLSMESKEIILDKHNNKRVVISVPKNLPKGSIMALSFEYPLFSNDLTIRDDKIRLDIDCSLYDDYSEYTKSD